MKIIKELGGTRPPLWNVRESYSNISKRLGVDEETVRMRVNRAKERGFLPTWFMMVNPLLISCHEAHLTIEVREEARKADTISKIKILDGVYYIVDFRGREIMVGIYYENEVIRSVRCGTPAQGVDLLPSLSSVSLIWNSVMRAYPRNDKQRPCALFIHN